MQTLQNSCPVCRHYSKMGKKGFCFKHDEAPSTHSAYCKDFKQKTTHTPIKNLHHVSSENEKSAESIEVEESYGPGQKLILAVFGGGLIVIIALLWASGVL